ncbi:MAG: NADH-quinone oxidoreductase subunit NuoB [Lachnospiraceae bacterium]|nr:NADH-quinone oxidoreductase subunit NuoB [Lachnospiraceae bacterium]
MRISKSPWLLHYDGSSCNGCDIEVLASTAPRFDVERFGIINTGNPKHADIFLCTGGVNSQNKDVVRQIYDQMPDPKVVLACGICACDGGIFKDCYNILGGTDTVIPVDVYVPGCAVRPEAIIDGVVKALKILDEKAEKMKRGEYRSLTSAEYAEKIASKDGSDGEALQEEKDA